MAKEYKVGEGYFLPVKITSTDYDREFPVQFSYFDGQDHYTECVQDGALLTAEEIVKASNLPAVLIEEGLTTRITELEAKNATLTAELEEEKANTYGWTNTAEERSRLISGLRESLNKASEENDELITKNNELEDANRSLTKACSEWQTAAQAHFKTTEKLREESKRLKQQLADANELLSDAQAQVKKLTEADCMRLQEFKPIIEERDKLKAEVATRTDNVKNLVEENDRLKKLLNRQEESMRGVEEYADQLKKIADDLGDENEKLKAELEQEKKRTQVWKDSSEEHRQRAEELDGDVKRYEMDIADNEVKIQRLGQENDSLKADILELKAQLNVLRSSQPDPREVEELEKRIAMLEKLKFSHIKTIQGFTKRLKEKDFMISALVRKGIELEEGGEQ
jgi:chromosome segregation ATPase